MESPRQLSAAAIEEFKVIYFEEFGSRLSDAEATEMAMRLLHLLKCLLETPR